MGKIVYDRFWSYIREHGITTYQLRNTYRLSGRLMTSLKQNRNMNSYTLAMLCDILKCRLEDIAEYVPDELNTGIRIESKDRLDNQ
jgi:DNA-binding Xre family transcriptional regulator